ncbi:TPA: Mbeg1-like protein [Streptococcus suis]
MPNLLTYIEESQYDTFYDQPINKLDILALTELSYLPFDNLVPYTFTETGIRLDYLAKVFEETYQNNFPPFSMVTKSRLTLLSLLAKSNRFKHLKAFGFVDDYQLDQEKQFSAISYRMDRQTILTCFRGTDDTIIGWKEDFHMTYMDEIPAQRSASGYLEKLMSSQNGNFYIAGHSKGGNLALYSACQQTSNLQERILAVYPFDAPGLHKKHLEAPGYQAIKDRIHPVIPQSSIVGMMLETPENAQIVQSNTIGLLQHISFSWEVEGNDFKPAPALTSDSLQTDQTFKTWTASLTDEELRNFFDLFFGIFIKAGIERFSDITVNPLQKLQEIDRLRKELSPEEAEMMDKLIRLLFDTRYQIWRDNLGNLLPNPEISLPDWRKLFQIDKPEKNEN